MLGELSSTQDTRIPKLKRYQKYQFCRNILYWGEDCLFARSHGCVHRALSRLHGHSLDSKPGTDGHFMMQRSIARGLLQEVKDAE